MGTEPPAASPVAEHVGVAVAIIGCGWITETTHVPALLAEPATRITAIVDEDHGRSAVVAGIVGEPVRRHTSLAELIAAGPLPDLAVVATPTASHPDLVDALLAAGVPVLCEKPLAPTATLARGVTERGGTTGFGVVHSHRYRRVVQAATRTVAEPAFGVPHVVRVRILLPSRPVGYGRDRHWRSGQQAGGAVRDLGYHAVYIAEELHASPIVAVRATTIGTSGGVDDHAVLLATHASGGLSVLEVGWHTARDEFHVAVTGRDAELRTTSAGELLLWRRTHDGPVTVPLATDGATPYRRLYRDVVAALRAGDAPGASPADAVHVLDVLDACRSSAADGGSVQVPRADGVAMAALGGRTA